MATDEAGFIGDFPVLKIRASSAAFYSINEIRLGGVDLLPFSVCGIALVTNSETGLTNATITFEVVPDIELPANARVGV